MTSHSSHPSEGIAPIARMPLEIINMICCELADNSANLARLGQTCRGFNLLVKPILYQHIEDHGRLRAESLMLALIDDPVCGKHIRSMKLRHWAMAATRDPDFMRNDLFDPVLDSLLGVDLEELKDKHRDLIILLALISLAPNMKTLEFCASDAWDDTDDLLNKSEATGRVTTPKRTLGQLTDLTVTFRHNYVTPHYNGVNLHKLRGLFRSAPNIKSLTIHSARGGTSLSATLPHLTTLRLTASYLCARGLRMLIRKSPHLAHFELTYDATPNRGCYLPVSPAQIVELLAPCRANLQKLHLGGYTPSWAQPGPFPGIRTLGDFPALRQVAVDVGAIVSRPDRAGLVELVRGCHGLRGFFLMGVEGFPRAEFVKFVRGMTEEMLW